VHQGRPLSGNVATGIDNNPVEPAFEVLARSVRLQVFEDSQKDVLGGILSVLPAAKHTPGSFEDPPLVADHYLFEGRRISLPGSFNEALEPAVTSGYVQDRQSRFLKYLADI
jgi:hypothetical protein